MSTCRQSQSWFLAFLSSFSSKFGHFFPSSSYGCVRSNYCNSSYSTVFTELSPNDPLSLSSPQRCWMLLEKTNSRPDWFHVSSWPHSSYLAFACPASSPSSLCNHITDFLDKVAVPPWAVLMRLLIKSLFLASIRPIRCSLHGISMQGGWNSFIPVVAFYSCHPRVLAREIPQC